MVRVGSFQVLGQLQTALGRATTGWAKKPPSCVRDSDSGLTVDLQWALAALFQRVAAGPGSQSGKEHLHAFSHRSRFGLPSPKAVVPLLSR